MKAKHDEARGVVVLTSGGDTRDERLLRRIINNLPVDQKMEYKGRDTRGENLKLFFQLGTEQITIMARDSKDENGIKAMRDPIYWGGGGLILLSHREKGGRLVVEVCMTRCKHCQAPLIKTGRCEWKVCDSCADKCQHQYVEGPTHGGPAGQLGIGEFCSLCGKGKPDGHRQTIIPFSTPAIAVMS